MEDSFVPSVIDMAEHMEDRKARFYRKVAGHIREGEFRDRFLCLASLEEEHEATFELMKRSLAGRNAGASDQEKELLPRLRVMCHYRENADLVDRLSGDETPSRLIDIALGLETDSILFYLFLKQAIPGEVDDAWIDVIIRNEMDHMISLVKERESFPA